MESVENKECDWRLQGQEKYLQGKKLVYKNYADRKTKTDHDHCEFCFDKFSDTISSSLNIGYATMDDYRWICEKCFADFKDKFKWIVESPSPICWDVVCHAPRALSKKYSPTMT